MRRVWNKNTWRGSEQEIARIGNDPVRYLKLIVKYEVWLGYEEHYGDFRKVMLDSAREVVRANQ